MTQQQQPQRSPPKASRAHVSRPRINEGSRLLAHAMGSFYHSDPRNIERIIPIINGQSPISLRLIDWTVTNYAREHNTVLTRRASDNSVVHFNVYLSYKSQLKAYSKQQFDPFRRRDRIEFFYERDKSVETTLGQLNFFRWVLQNDILGFIGKNMRRIENHMIRRKEDESRDLGSAAAVTTTTTTTAAPPRRRSPLPSLPSPLSPQNGRDDDDDDDDKDDEASRARRASRARMIPPAERGGKRTREDDAAAAAARPSSSSPTRRTGDRQKTDGGGSTPPSTKVSGAPPARGETKRKKDREGTECRARAANRERTTRLSVAGARRPVPRDEREDAAGSSGADDRKSTTSSHYCVRHHAGRSLVSFD